MNREERRNALKDLRKMSSEGLIQLGLDIKSKELHKKISVDEAQEHISMIEKVLKERGRILDFNNNIMTNIGDIN